MLQHIENTLILCLVLIFCLVVSKKIKWQLSILLLVAGALISFTSHQVLFFLQPELVFFIFLPPILFSAALNVSLHEMHTWKLPILGLSVGLVVFTVLIVGASCHYLAPSFGWQFGLLLGAIIAPPDAIAAIGVTKELNISSDITTVIEGESMINDASALVIYQYALMNIITAGNGSQNLLFHFLVLSLGGAIFGASIGYILRKIVGYINDTNSVVLLFIITPIGVYIVAEHLHLSGVIAVVACGLFISMSVSRITSFQERMRGREFGTIIDFLLNGFVFLLIGIQLRSIIQFFEWRTIIYLTIYSIGLCLLIFIVRLLWIYLFGCISLILNRVTKKHDKFFSKGFSAKFMIVAWANVRGVVSLAAALAIPLTLHDKPFPYRNEILFITFAVILLTLIIHGLTLPIIVKKFNMIKTAEINTDKAQLYSELLSHTSRYIDIVLRQEFPPQLVDKILNEYSYMKDFVFDASQSGEQILQLTLEIEIISYQYQILQQMHRSNRYSKEILLIAEQSLDMINLSLDTKLKRISEIGKCQTIHGS